MDPIPFNKAFFCGDEIRYIQKAINQNHISGDGPFTKSCQNLLQNTLGVEKALLTTSCTDALEMAAHLLDIHEGDEVIVPSFTFVSSINAFVLLGAKPVFCDIRVDTLNIDEKKIEKLITPRTKAIIVVHYAGVACEMKTITEVANRYGIPIVEDNAHGLFGKYEGKYLGTFGSIATQSFHETKNISCGEGGALLLNDKRLIERAEILRDKGTDRSRFMRGLVDKYTWVDKGSSYLPSDLLAAFLFAQLENQKRIQASRKRIWDYYFKNLSDWSKSFGVQLPHVPSHCDQSYHMFYLKLPTTEIRNALLDYLKGFKIGSVFHYIPLHSSPMGKQLAPQTSCPVTDETSATLLRLPFFNDMTEEQLAYVTKTIQTFEVEVRVAA